MSPSGQHSLFRRLGIALAVVLFAVACSDSDDEGSADAASTLEAFCPRAEEYLRFEPAFGSVAGDPVLTRTFVDAWLDRLATLEDRSPEDVVDEVVEIRRSVEEFDSELRAVDDDVFALSFEQLDRLDDDLEADESDRLFRAYVQDNCGAAEAPSPLSEEELAELLGDDVAPDDLVDREVSAELVSQLQTILGLTPEASACVAANLDPAALDGLLSGIFDPVALTTVLDTCDISVEDLTDD